VNSSYKDWNQTDEEKYYIWNPHLSGSCTPNSNITFSGKSATIYFENSQSPPIDPTKQGGHAAVGAWWYRQFELFNFKKYPFSYGCRVKLTFTVNSAEPFASGDEWRRVAVVMAFAIPPGIVPKSETEWYTALYAECDFHRSEFTNNYLGGIYRYGDFGSICLQLIPIGRKITVDVDLKYQAERIWKDYLKEKGFDIDKAEVESVYLVVEGINSKIRVTLEAPFEIYADVPPSPQETMAQSMGTTIQLVMSTMALVLIIGLATSLLKSFKEKVS
jgi:hypothetical protein